MRRPERLGYSQLLRMVQTCGIHVYGRQSLQSGEVSHHLAVVTAQKFVSRSRHVNVVRLAFGTFLVQELEHRLIRRSTLQMYFHDVKQRSAQIGRAAFRGPVAARAVIARFARRRVNACEGNKRLLAIKAAHIPNLRHELRAEGFPDAVHLHDDRVFRELRSQLVHLAAVGFHAARDRRELVDGFLEQAFS